MQVTDPLTLDSVMLAGARSYLRIEHDAEDALLGDIMRAAICHAESFTGQLLIRRDVQETITATAQWQMLQSFPVVTVSSVAGLPAEGSGFVFATTEWEAKIGSHGEAYVRILQQGSAGRAVYTAQAGVAENWAALPESLKLGILRLAAHLHAHRDAADDAGLPEAALALLRPWRRMRLS